MNKQILFIEDEQALQKTLGGVIEKEGIKIISALNGENGIKLAQKKQPDLILLDLILPRKDGFEVLKNLKSNEETDQIPVIVLTNLEAMEDIQKALRLGATTYLVKANYEIKEVIKKIKTAFKE